MPGLDELYPFVAMDPDDTSYELDWLVPGLLMRRKINVWFGAEKAGKSRLIAWLLPHLLSGTSVFGQASQARASLGMRVLYLAGEETRQEVTARLVASQRLAGIPSDAIRWQDQVEFCEGAGMRLDKPAQRSWLRKRLASGSFDTLVVDPLRRVHGAVESSNDAMAPICNELREWTNRYGLTLWLTHHTGKLGPDDDESRIATWSRGATDLPAVLDWAVYVKRQREGPEDHVQLVRQGRAPREGTLLLRDGPSGFERLAELGSHRDESQSQGSHG